MKTIGIIGYGEIGRGLDTVYLDGGFTPLIKDLNRDDGLRKVDVLNICIPWSNTFVRDVTKYLKELSPGLAIIHSTVPPGTTKSIPFPRLVHSPVRGTHPNLDAGIKTFTKIFGSELRAVALDAATHFSMDLNVQVLVYESSKDTEIAKLLDTSYFGVCIAWHEYAERLCKQHGVSFDDVQTDYNLTYNSGYKELGRPNVVRPVLSPPGKHIGGHCVVPNAEILRKELDSPLLKAITDLK